VEAGESVQVDGHVVHSRLGRSPASASSFTSAS
jgi:hypothetical protein